MKCVTLPVDMLGRVSLSSAAPSHNVRVGGAEASDGRVTNPITVIAGEERRGSWVRDKRPRKKENRAGVGSQSEGGRLNVNRQLAMATRDFTSPCSDS